MDSEEVTKFHAEEICIYFILNVLCKTKCKVISKPLFFILGNIQTKEIFLYIYLLTDKKWISLTSQTTDSKEIKICVWSLICRIKFPIEKHPIAFHLRQFMSFDINLFILLFILGFRNYLIKNALGKSGQNWFLKNNR